MNWRRPLDESHLADTRRLIVAEIAREEIPQHYLGACDCQPERHRHDEPPLLDPCSLLTANARNTTSARLPHTSWEGTLMPTKLLSAILVTSLFALSVPVFATEANTEVLLTSGSAYAHAGLGGVNLHGQDFDLSAWGWVNDFTPMDMCDPSCPFGGIIWNLVDTLGPIPGTLTWEGVSYPGITVDGAASGFGIRLPSEVGMWHVDVPSSVSFSIPELDLIATGAGMWPLDIQCYGDDYSSYCVVYGTLGVVVKRQVLACDGFASPADDGISLLRKSNRVIPLRMTLQDWRSQAPATDANIPGSAPPVVEISFSPGPGISPIDVTDQFAPLGSDGGSFTYNSTINEWQLNLSTKAYTAAGTYVVRVRPGSSDYAIIRNDFDPTCEAQFVRE